jgi:hypothetical protein
MSSLRTVFLVCNKEFQDVTLCVYWFKILCPRIPLNHRDLIFDKEVMGVFNSLRQLPVHANIPTNRIDPKSIRRQKPLEKG